VFGELLKHGHANDPAVAREFGEYIETESRRLTSLINNILDFSHIESGRKGYQFAPTDLRTLIAETIKADEVRLKHEGFELRFVAAPTPLVAVDAEAIAQAFVNLLDNAAKYSGSARVIEVRVQAQREAVTIAVSDHGIGIAPDEQEKIFEKFYRAGSSLVHDVKGSGLGLSIVRHIVAAHRGHVTVESELGQGSTFTIHLPVPVNADENADAMAMMQPSLEGK
jgi:signal transduction histidine kinase